MLTELITIGYDLFNRNPKRAPASKNPIAVQNVPTGGFSVMHLLGFLFIAVSLPPVGIICGCGYVWYYIDPVTLRVCRLLSKLMAPFSEKFVRNKADTFLVPVLLLQAVAIPLMFACCLYYHLNYGFSLTHAFVYHLIRTGPFVSNFAYAYTLCHKEGHSSRVGMFQKPYSYLLQNVWNWWIGVFYGVVPSTFAFGHSLNHHTYNNDRDDVVTTWDRPRDSFFNYVRYLPRWLSYSINISTVVQFAKEKNFIVVKGMLAGSFYYSSFLAVFFYINPTFAAVYLLYPLVEASLLLSAINWSWHSFLDPDTKNVFAHSVTIFNGPETSNVLNEDYHVVHHQYPGAHWTKHPALYEKHKQEYIDNKATCFDNTHAMELFFLAVASQYEILADKFVDVSGKMSREEVVALIKTRLRTCSWGEYTNKVK